MREIKIGFPKDPKPGDSLEIRDDGFSVTLPMRPLPGFDVTIKRIEKSEAPGFVAVHTADGKLVGMLAKGESVEYRAVRRHPGRWERFLDWLLRRTPRETAWDKTKFESDA